MGNPKAYISIHALRGEGDAPQAVAIGSVSKISIHALRGEGDSERIPRDREQNISIHALRGEGDDLK